jgi:hemerythrin
MVFYMTLITWTDSFSVKVSEIDKQHKKLIDMINNLHEAMKEGKSKEVMGDILKSLLSYTETHFKLEEKYFDLYNYPAKENHKAKHKQFIDTVTKFKNDFDSGKTTLSLEVMNFQKDWWTKHINGTDKEYAKFFNDHGLK